MFAQGTDGAAAVSAAKAAGASVVSVDRKLGYAVVRSGDAGLVGKLSTARGVEGTARDRVIGAAPKGGKDRIERPSLAGRPQAQVAAADAPSAVAADPLANRQWDMRQIGATASGSYAVDPGQPGACSSASSTPASTARTRTSRRTSTRRCQPQLRHRHPDDRRALRGPDRASTPPNEDDDGHGTHVASTIGSPINGLGMAGVAPNVTLVNIRAGQDSGFFFLQPTARGPRLRRRHRRRRGQHELLHRPVALRLPAQPGGLARRSRPSSA